MSLCPRCKKETLKIYRALNALSRRDAETYICNTCGHEEALIDCGAMEPDDIEREFVAKVGK